MKAYEQLAEISGGELTIEEAKRGFENWLKETNLDEKEAESNLFSMPPQASIALLKIHS